MSPQGEASQKVNKANEVKHLFTVKRAPVEPIAIVQLTREAPKCASANPLRVVVSERC